MSFYIQIQRRAGLLPGFPSDEWRSWREFFYHPRPFATAQAAWDFSNQMDEPFMGITGRKMTKTVVTENQMLRGQKLMEARRIAQQDEQPHEDRTKPTMSDDVYRKIHRWLAHTADEHLRDQKLAEALSTAAQMRLIEQHTKIDFTRITRLEDAA